MPRLAIVTWLFDTGADAAAFRPPHQKFGGQCIAPTFRQAITFVQCTLSRTHLFAVSDAGKARRQSLLFSPRGRGCLERCREKRVSRRRRLLKEAPTAAAPSGDAVKGSRIEPPTKALISRRSGSQAPSRLTASSRSPPSSMAMSGLLRRSTPKGLASTTMRSVSPWPLTRSTGVKLLTAISTI